MTQSTQVSQNPKEVVTPSDKTQTILAQDTYYWPGANGMPTWGFGGLSGSIQNTGAGGGVFSVEYSNDGTNWDAVDTETVAAGDEWDFNFPVKWTYIRLRFTATNNTTVTVEARLMPIGVGGNEEDFDAIIGLLTDIELNTQEVADTVYTEDATVGIAGAAKGQLVGGAYEQVPNQVEDRDFKQFLIDAFGEMIIAGYNSALGSLQMVEQSPPIYDTLSGTFVAAAALPGAGAWSAWYEVPTGGRGKILVIPSYTRAAAGGSFRMEIRSTLTVAATDYDARPAFINAGAFAAGADVNSSAQAENYLYASTGAGAELSWWVFDLGSGHKCSVRFQEVGAVANPGTLACVFNLHNR